MRMPAGIICPVGGAGRILTDGLGECPDLEFDIFGLATLADAEEVEEALLWDMTDGWWMCMLRTEDTEDDVDLRPPMPERRL